METFSALLALCAGNSPVPGEFPTQTPVTWSFDVFFDLRLNKPLRKQSWGWWFQTPSCSLWRHCNVNDIFIGASSISPVSFQVADPEVVLCLNYHYIRELKLPPSFCVCGFPMCAIITETEFFVGWGWEDQQYYPCLLRPILPTEQPWMHKWLSGFVTS